MKKLFALCAAFLIAACSNAPAPLPPQTLSFKQYAPINVNVARIDVVDEYKSPLRAPNVEHLIPYSPANAMHIWVKDRLRAVGKDGVLQVTIKDGSVIATDLPKTPGFQGLIKNEQDKRYDGKIAVDMRIYDGGAMSKADVSASASHTFTIAEKASVVERKAAFMDMINQMMANMNAQLEKNMDSYMGDYINAAPR